MNKQAVIEIIKNIFATRGYSIGYSEICDLLAEKDSEHILIKFENYPNLNNIRYFSNTVKRYGKGIVISESFEENIRMFALDDGITLWDRSELETQIGRAVLGRALDAHREEPAVVENNISSSIQEPENVPDTNEPEIKEYEKTIRVMLHTVPLNIGKKDAFSIAEAKIGTPKSQALKFIPVWYYNYSFNIQKKYKSKMVDLSGAGEGYVHALTGENFFNKYREFLEKILIPTQNYEICQPVIQKKDAGSKAINAIVREHTKEIRLNELIGDTIVFEKRMFAPDPAEISLKIELLHIPVWEIKGKREVIDINGYDGHIMSIKLYNDAELV